MVITLLRRAGAGGSGFWEEAGRTILAAPATSMSVSLTGLKKFVMIEMYIISDGVVTAAFRFNSDSGANYARALVRNGGAAFFASGQTSAQMINATRGLVGTIYGRNIATKNKNFIGSYSEITETTGGGSVDHSSFKWVNTVDLITSMQLINTGANNFDTGTEIVVSHHD